MKDGARAAGSPLGSVLCNHPQIESSKPDTLDFVDDLFAEDETERILALSPAALHEEMGAERIDPARARVLLDRLLAEVPTAEESPRRLRVRAKPRRVPVVWIVVAGAVAIAIATVVIARPAVVAWLMPAPPFEPAPAPPRVAPPATPEQIAVALRQDALAACAKGSFHLCEHGLDQAKALDPAGENDARVRKARASIREGNNPAPFEGAKPRLSSP